MNKKDLIRATLEILNKQIAVMVANHDYRDAERACEVARELHEWKHEPDLAPGP